MARWFRHYVGMMRDEKLVRAALKSGQTIERVVWVWGAILESASEIDDGGRYEVDTAEIAYFLRADETDIQAIVAALEALERLDGGCVAKWGDRQYQSDRSADRQARYRERKRENNNAGNNTKTSRDVRVTSPSRHGDAPDTDTDTDTDTERKKVKPTVLPKKGSRLPEDWQPTDPDMQAAVKKIGTQGAAEELETFRDYWRAKPGKDGVKLDWDATWRNWVRNSRRNPREGPPKVLRGFQ